jgi:tetratricopeptide (TPR) repeat protein
MQRLLNLQSACLRYRGYRFLLALWLGTVLSWGFPLSAGAAPVASPVSSTTPFQQGVEATLAGKYTEAFTAFTTAIQTRTNTAAAYANRCLVEILLDQPEPAIKDCTQALQQQPNNSEAYLNRGLAHYHLSHYQAAIDDTTAVLRLQPEDFRAYYNRGCTYHRQGNYLAAIQDFDRALQLNPGIPEAYRDRALAYYDLGNAQQAFIDLQQAVQSFRQQGKTAAYQQTLSLIQQIQQIRASESAIG